VTLPGRLLIRADAGAETGTGHVMRSLALAQAWQAAGGDAVFVTAMDSLGLEARLLAEGIEIEPLSAPPGSRDDARQTAEAARRRRASWIVVDGYQFGGDYQRMIKECGLGLLVLDDYSHAEHYWADLVLNQNLHAEETLYRAREPYTRLLLGTRYVLLRREFWKWQGRNRHLPPIARRLLVTMGGADPDNVTLRLLQAVERLEIEDLETVVIVGHGNRHLEELQVFADECPVPIRLRRNADDMPQWMAWADAAITAAGSTTWELAYFGLPSLTVVLANNQQRSARLLMEREVFPTLGRAAAAETSSIVHRTRRFLLDRDARKRCRDRAARLVDGLGAFRVVNLLRSEEGPR
jgi:UDP-2,4-diacetamido-2,4,6-trideoxy-beta-L-altropyranose hydrolase